MAFCAECGTAFPPEAPPTEPPVIAPPFLPTAPRVLNAGYASIVFGVYLAAQFAGGMFASIFGMLFGLRMSGGGEDDAGNLQAILPLAMILAMVFSGTAIVLIAFALELPLKDGSPTGAAWVRGSWRNIAKGLSTGVLIAVLWTLLLLNFGHYSQNGEAIGPLTRMGITPGFSQIVWVLLALMFAPPIEELLFRGIVYGGYRKSFGPVIATTVTTVVFVLLHYTEFIHQPLAILSITSMALLALWWRLRSNAIGPAIAAHFGYNAVLVVVLVCNT